MLKNKTILLTGGAGFIGSNILEQLIALEPKFIKIIDNLSTGNYENIKQLVDKNDNIEFIKGDIEDYDLVCKIMEGVNLVCHQAALGSVPRSIDDPLNSHKSNVNGFLNILIASKNNNVDRVVFASSSSVYGDIEDDYKKENNIGQPLSPYAVTKYIDEIYASLFNRVYDLKTVGLRYFNVFGPKQNPNGCYAAVIPKFIISMLKNESPVINGNGKITRDFTYVNNAVAANILALTIDNNKAFNKIYNIACGEKNSIHCLVDKFNTILGTNIKPVYGPSRKGDIQNSCADISKAKELLGYKPIIEFDDGLVKTVEYYKNNIYD